MNAPLRSGDSHHGQCRPRRARLRHRDRPRAHCHARRADRGAPAGMQGGDRHRRDRRAASSRRGRSRAEGRRRRRRVGACAGGRKLQELRDAGARQRRAARGEDRARRPRGCARRRRDRRPCGLRRGDPAPRRGLCAGADDTAGAGGFLGRRQDRDQCQARQEPGRRVLSADPGAGRHRAARHPARARVPRRLRRGGEVRPARRSAVL